MRARLAIAIGAALVGCNEARPPIVADRPAPRPSASLAPRAPTLSPRLVVHQRLGKPLRVDGCLPPAPCVEWVRFPVKPPRMMVEASASPSGRYFYLWSRADGHARELDVYETPTAGPARRSSHAVPGAGGHLGWVAGDRLFHWWGCGTGCAMVEVRDVLGRVLVSTGGAWVEEEATHTRAAVADHGGKVVWIDFALGAGYESDPIAGALWPIAVAWEKDALKVTYSQTSGTDRVLVCRPSPVPTKAALGILSCA